MATLREQLIAQILNLDDSRLQSVSAHLLAMKSGFAANESGEGSPHSKDWPHAPVHRLSKDGTYIVTGGTYGKQHHFGARSRLDYLETKMLELARHSGWHFEAWAVFSNHYHFIAHATTCCGELKEMLDRLHRESAMEVNRLDNRLGRQVWFNYWDTRLTFEKSYLARLNYVHQNAVKHRLVTVANQYPWCSAAWFERTARRAQVRTIYSFKTDVIKLHDDFEPVILECGDPSPLSLAAEPLSVEAKTAPR